MCVFVSVAGSDRKVFRGSVRQRELILTEKIDIEYSMRYETLALITLSEF